MLRSAPERSLASERRKSTMILRLASNLVRVNRCPSLVAAIGLIAALPTAGCSASSTTTATATGPDPVKCQVTLASPSVVDANGGAGRLSVSTQPECAWTASSAVNWISGLSPASGQGTGDVDFRVAANDGGSGREGDIVINDIRARVTQRAPCRYEVTPPNQSVGAGAGGGSVTVTTSAECAWTANTDVGWISVEPPRDGSGRGTVGFTVAANGGNERSGTITIAGQRSIVTQAGAAAPCTFAISPSSQNIAASGGTGTVAMSTQAGCRWSATSDASWITVASGGSGAGNGSIGFSVAANTGAARTGTLTIGGRAFTVSQAAPGAPAPAPPPPSPPPPPPPPPPCNYSVSPDEVKFKEDAGSGTVNVSTGSTCAWTARSNDSWITVTAGASGTGNGAVRFNVAANTGKKREGSLTVAGQAVKVEQGDK